MYDVCELLVKSCTAIKAKDLFEIARILLLFRLYQELLMLTAGCKFMKNRIVPIETGANRGTLGKSTMRRWNAVKTISAPNRVLQTPTGRGVLVFRTKKKTVLSKMRVRVLGVLIYETIGLL